MNDRSYTISRENKPTSPVLTLAHAKSRLTRAKSRLTRANEYIETNLRYVFIYKKPDTLLYAIFHEVFEFGIYIQKHETLRYVKCLAFCI